MLKNFLYHNSTERKASMLLILLVFVLIALCWCIPYLVTTPKYDYSQFKKEAAAFAEGLHEVEKSDDASNSEYGYSTKKYPKKEKK